MKPQHRLHRGMRAALAVLAVVGSALSTTATSSPSDATDAGFALPVPADAELSPLGDRLRINGQEARLHELITTGSIDALLSFYRQQFGDTASEPRGPAGQRIVGGVIGNRYVTVQADDDPARAPDAPIHARVLQTRLQPRAAVDTRGAVLPMPVDSRLLSDVESQDGDRRARLRVYRNRHSVDANLAFVQREFASLGLVPVERGAKDDAAQALLWFVDDRGGEAMVSVHNAGEQRLVSVHTVAQLSAFEVQR